jgi:hypothetical protein
MKNFMYLTLLLIGLGSCQKEGISPIQDEAPSISNNDSLVATGGPKSTMTEYAVSPKFGKPNSTYYYFKVYDPAGTLALAVKLYDKATGTTTYFPMTKIGSYWTLSKTIASNGWYDYRYVYNITHANISTTTAYTLSNSKNMFNSSPFAIVWPFGADGSSWYNRTVFSQSWNGGQEGGSGNGWGQGAHTGTTEQYSDDWNRGTGSQDLGAIIRSPLDGYIDAIGQYYVSGYGYSTYVAVIQQASNGTLYRFYVAHLQSYPGNLYVGKYIRAGIDQIGTLGSSGTSSPHAHTNMRVNGVSVPFYFNAQ